MKVAVGSTNPVKVGAAERVFHQLFPGSVVVGISVPSGVPEQPIGEDETLRGAIERARAALKAADAEWGVGMEGGVTFQGDQCWLNGYCAVVHRSGSTGVGKGAQFLLPPAIGAAVRAGGELGPLMDQLTGSHEIKRKGGAVGFFTNGAVVREDLFSTMVATALVPFLHQELYPQ